VFIIVLLLNTGHYNVENVGVMHGR